MKFPIRTPFVRRTAGIVKTRPVDGFVLDEVVACVAIGREWLRTALSGAVVFCLRFSAFFIHSIVGLLDAGLHLCEELENAVEVDPGELDNGMLAVHELREPDHTFSSCCARQDNHLELQGVVQLGVRIRLVFFQVRFPQD